MELTEDKEKMKERKQQYQALKQQFDENLNPRSPPLIPRAGRWCVKQESSKCPTTLEVAADGKHSLIVHFQVTNENDRKALYPTVMAAKQNMGLTRDASLTALADKGYFNQEQLQRCYEDHILTYVPPTYNRSSEANPVKATGWRILPIILNQTAVPCPQGRALLSTNGHWYKKVYLRHEKTKSSYPFKHYKTNKCPACPAFHLCTVHKTGRVIEQSRTPKPWRETSNE